MSININSLNKDALAEVCSHLDYTSLEKLKGTMGPTIDKEKWEEATKLSFSLRANRQEIMDQDLIQMTSIIRTYLGRFPITLAAETARTWLKDNEELDQIHGLVFSNLDLYHLPPEISNLKNLFSLALSNNYLTELPIETLKKLEKLKILNCNNNYFTDETKAHLKNELKGVSIFF